MVICFSCSADIKEKLDLVVSRGGYKDYTAAISSAIANLLVLEEQVGRTGSMVMDSGSHPSGRRVTAPSALDVENVANAAEGYTGVFAPFALPSFKCAPVLAAVRGDDVAAKDGIAPKQWIFGQYNKFLPIKANCRLIARMLQKSPDGVSLQAVADSMQQCMPELRQFLEAFDAKYQLERESSLATAFPTKDSKSLLRYTNQFVMGVNKSGALSGFPVAFGFLNRLETKGTWLSLTDVGLHFALLANPVLDPPREPQQRLSEQETRFLLEHIRSFVPREHAAYLSVLHAIEGGGSTPETLDAALRLLENAVDAKISDPYLSTQRAGVVSRMTELGLVTRQREGIRVSYSITPEGRAYSNGEESAVA
jgi:hypothetical protein